MTDSTSMLSAKTTTEQPIPQQPRNPEPPHLVSMSPSLPNKVFSLEVADRITAPQKLSTRAIYASKWVVFQSWCTHKWISGVPLCRAHLQFPLVFF